MNDLYVLAVVGEPLAERLLRRYLNNHGFWALVVTNEQDALDALERFTIDVVIVDIDSVDFDVTTFIRLLKLSSPETRTIATIVISNDIGAYMTEEERRECVDALVSRPAHPQTLLETINAVRLGAFQDRSSE